MRSKLSLEDIEQRTLASQVLDLDEWEKKTGKTKKAVNGVTAKVLLPVDFHYLMLPILHIVIGLVNFHVQKLRDRHFQLFEL